MSLEINERFKSVDQSFFAIFNHQTFILLRFTSIEKNEINRAFVIVAQRKQKETKCIEGLEEEKNDSFVD